MQLHCNSKDWAWALIPLAAGNGGPCRWPLLVPFTDAGAVQFPAASEQSELATAMLTSATADVAYQQLQFDVHIGLEVKVAQFHENLTQLSQLWHMTHMCKLLLDHTTAHCAKYVVQIMPHQCEQLVRLLLWEFF